MVHFITLGQFVFLLFLENTCSSKNVTYIFGEQERRIYDSYNFVKLICLHSTHIQESILLLVILINKWCLKEIDMILDLVPLNRKPTTQICETLVVHLLLIMRRVDEKDIYRTEDLSS